MSMSHIIHDRHFMVRRLDGPAAQGDIARHAEPVAACHGAEALAVCIDQGHACSTRQAEAMSFLMSSSGAGNWTVRLHSETLRGMLNLSRPAVAQKRWQSVLPRDTPAALRSRLRCRIIPVTSWLTCIDPARHMAWTAGAASTNKGSCRHARVRPGAGQVHELGDELAQHMQLEE